MTAPGYTTDQPAEQIIATPAMVEARLYELGRELDHAVAEVKHAEAAYLRAKTAYDLAYARAYLTADGKNATSRDAHTLLQCRAEKDALTEAEVLVRALKENTRRIYTHVDIARSVSVIVRAGIGAS